MKLKDIYRMVVKKGMKEDPRAKKSVQDGLKKARNEYRRLKGADKKAFDTERMKNPYSDTRILNGTGNEEIKTVLVGIDVDVQEILLADRLRQQGVRIDLVISHHPAGRAYAEMHRVMDVQTGIWENYGFKQDVAEGIMKDRKEEVARAIAARNHTRVVDAAKLLGIPYMCMHTASDNCVASYLQHVMDREKPKKVKDIMSRLKRIPEYRIAMANGAGPYILTGNENAKTGRVFVDMTGGTNGPDRLWPRLSQAGVNTILFMHLKESAYKIAKAEFLNCIVAGHISSDNIGMNLLFDEIEKKGRLKIIECSGFRRVRRKR